MTLEPSAKGLSLDKLHRYKDLPLMHADVVNHHDIGVAELRQGLCLSLQPHTSGLSLGIASSLGLEQLQGHTSIELRIVGRDHNAHGASAKSRKHDVAPHHLPALGHLEALASATVPVRVDGRVAERDLRAPFADGDRVIVRVRHGRRESTAVSRAISPCFRKLPDRGSDRAAGCCCPHKKGRRSL